MYYNLSLLQTFTMLSLPCIFLFLLPLALGKEKVGELSDRQNHDVSGTVYKMDEEHILIEDFTYDGSVGEQPMHAGYCSTRMRRDLSFLLLQAPDAFFYVGKSGSPSGNGYRVPYPVGQSSVLGRFNGEDVTIRLQNGWKTSQIK